MGKHIFLITWCLSHAITILMQECTALQFSKQNTCKIIRKWLSKSDHEECVSRWWRICIQSSIPIKEGIIFPDLDFQAESLNCIPRNVLGSRSGLLLLTKTPIKYWLVYTNTVLALYTKYMHKHGKGSLTYLSLACKFIQFAIYGLWLSLAILKTLVVWNHKVFIYIN